MGKIVDDLEAILAAHPHRTANSAGKATVPYYISGATPGFRVVVKVYVSKGSRKGTCSASFLPHR